MPVSLEARADQLKWLIVCGMLAGLALSPKLWIATRAYPLTPVLEFLPRLGNPWDVLLFIAFAIALAAVAIAARPVRPIVIALCLGAILVALDQSRLQPWFYQYLLTLAALAFFYSSPNDLLRTASLNACRLLIATIYFWSGVQKLNPNFADGVLLWMLQPIVHLFPELVRTLLRFGIAVPLTEIAIGLGLLSRCTRNVAIAFAIAMHCLLLAALGPFGRDANSVVWPWNIVMIAALVILFRRTPDLSARDICIPSGPVAWRAAVIFAAAAPALSLIGLWDHYPSWAMYSGDKDEATIYISDALFEKLPEDIQDYVDDDPPGVNSLNIYDWSWGELNVPVYPEPRIYRNIAASICRYAAAPGDLKLKIQPKRILLAPFRGAPYPAKDSVQYSDCSANK